MERYCYEGATKTSGRNEDGVYRYTEVPAAGFCIYDRKRGLTYDLRLGWCHSRDDAALIVDALNTRALLVDSVDRS